MVTMVAEVMFLLIFNWYVGSNLVLFYESGANMLYV